MASQHNNEIVNIKFKLISSKTQKEVLRRVSLSDPTLKMIRELINIWSTSIETLSYVDSDSDNITLETIVEWDECLRLWREDRKSVLRIVCTVGKLLKNRRIVQLDRSGNISEKIIESLKVTCQQSIPQKGELSKQECVPDLRLPQMSSSLTIEEEETEVITEVIDHNNLIAINSFQSESEQVMSSPTTEPFDVNTEPQSEVPQEAAQSEEAEIPIENTSEESCSKSEIDVNIPQEIIVSQESQQVLVSSTLESSDVRDSLSTEVTREEDVEPQSEASQSEAEILIRNTSEESCNNSEVDEDSLVSIPQAFEVSETAAVDIPHCDTDNTDTATLRLRNQNPEVESNYTPLIQSINSGEEDNTTELSFMSESSFFLCQSDDWLVASELQT